MKNLALLILGLTLAGQASALELKDSEITLQGNPATVKTLESGMTVYTFDPDQGATVPACKADCAEKWPPILMTAKEESELSSEFGSIKRANNLIQLTYKGRPVYSFFADRIPGDAKGEGLGNVWFVVRP